jgi:hypothetical protein
MVGFALPVGSANRTPARLKFGTGWSSHVSGFPVNDVTTPHQGPRAQLREAAVRVRLISLLEPRNEGSVSRALRSMEH